MAGEKNLLSRSVVRHLRVPRYQEFTLQQVYDLADQDVLLKSYLPDLDMARRPPNREFVFQILATVRPEKFDYMMQKSLEQRNVFSKNKKDPSTLKISSEAAEVLLYDFYAPSKYPTSSKSSISASLYRVQGQRHRESSLEFQATP